MLLLFFTLVFQLCFITATLYLTSQFEMEVFFFNNICKTTTAAPQSPICRQTPTAAAAPKQHSPFHKGRNTNKRTLWQRSLSWIFFFKAFSGLAGSKKKGQEELEFCNHTMTTTAEKEKQITHLWTELLPFVEEGPAKDINTWGTGKLGFAIPFFHTLKC